MIKINNKTKETGKKVGRTMLYMTTASLGFGGACAGNFVSMVGKPIRFIGDKMVKIGEVATDLGVEVTINSWDELDK